MSTTPKIVLIGGPQATGKTTLAKKLSSRLDIPWISTDQIRTICAIKPRSNEMGTERIIKGYVAVVRPYRKHGNGGIGGGRKGSSGKRCLLYKIDSAGNRELVASAEGPTAKVAAKKLRDTVGGIIPTHVAINHQGETSF